MTQLKYKVGDMVRFTLDKSGDPSNAEWLKGAKEGKGIVITIDEKGFTSYGVKVIDPRDWEGGHGLGGRLLGPDKYRKGIWFIDVDSLRPAEPTRASAPTKSTAREKSDEDRMRAWFMQTKEEPAVRCPNPGCNGAKTEKIFFSVSCPICGWTSHGKKED